MPAPRARSINPFERAIGNRLMHPSGDQTLLDWLLLQSVPGIGNRLFKRLVDCFGTATDVLRASDTALLSVPGITRRHVDGIRKGKLPDSVPKDLDACRQKGYRVVKMTDDGFPPLLRQIPDPPPLLYVAGALPLPSEFLAVVGCRHPTPYGLSATRMLVQDLVATGLVIVSGMAKGIDTAAHESALLSGGRTVAVMGSGLERIYPTENRGLFRRIMENGAVVTEFSPFTPPASHHFPMRNRIISGMSRGTLVVEAGKTSGALITARLALEQNREVFAVPGTIQSYKSFGPNALIRQGAKLVVQARDIIEEIHPMMDGPAMPFDRPAGQRPPEPELTDEEATVFSRLDVEPVHMDVLARTLSMPPGRLSAVLLQLELKGVIRQLAGHRFVITT